MGNAGETVTVREAVLDLLRQLGMTTVFGNPGSTELPFLADWPADFRYVLGLQEASVVGMADGYARVSGRAALCNLHSAAGLGHALGNVFTAFRNQAPLVITAGQQARPLLPLNPFLGATDAAAFAKPYVKWSCEPARAEDVPAALAHAAYVAMQPPWGPTFVSIPVDDWAARAAPVVLRQVSRRIAPDPALLDEAARVLDGAARPALVIGPEVDQDGAGEAAVALAERLRAPVWASPFSSRLSFPELHPLFAGFLPAAPGEVAAALSDHDALLVLGAPVFSFHVGGDCALFRGGVPLFQITADAEAIAAAGMGTGILGSPALALPELAARLGAAERTPPAPRRRPPPPSPRAPIAAEFLLHSLARAMPADAVLVEEAPSHRPAMQAQLPLTHWGSFYTTASGGLGYGLPAAVGVALAEPARPVVCLIGDGSMMYSVQALWTAVQQRLNLTVIVLGNGGYGAMRAFSRVLGVQGAPGIDLPGLDFLALAAGMGCPGTRVTEPEAVGAALEAAFGAGGPHLLELVLDPAVPRLYATPD